MEEFIVSMNTHRKKCPFRIIVTRRGFQGWSNVRIITDEYQGVRILEVTTRLIIYYGPLTADGCGLDPKLNSMLRFDNWA